VKFEGGRLGAEKERKRKKDGTECELGFAKRVENFHPIGNNWTKKKFHSLQKKAYNRVLTPYSVINAETLVTVQETFLSKHAIYNSSFLKLLDFKNFTI